MDMLQWAKLWCMLLSDRPKFRVDGVIFHGRSFNGDEIVARIPKYQQPEFGSCVTYQELFEYLRTGRDKIMA